MRRRMLLCPRLVLPLIGAAALLCGSVYSTSARLVPPPPRPVPAPVRFADDARLDQKISVTAWAEPLEEVLDRVSAPFFYLWRREGDVVLFRNRNWFLENWHSVPKRDIRRWRRRLKEGGRLELEDLADLALLTDRQLRNVEGAGIPTGTARAHREVLAFYASLRRDQREQLAERGLQVRELEPAQAARLGAWKPSQAAGADGRLWLRREKTAVVFRLEADASEAREERVTLGVRGPQSRV